MAIQSQIDMPINMNSSKTVDGKINITDKNIKLLWKRLNNLKREVEKLNSLNSNSTSIDAVINATIDGDGTINTVAKFIAEQTIGNSTITDTGTLITLAAGGTGVSVNQYGLYRGVNSTTAAIPLYITGAAASTYGTYLQNTTNTGYVEHRLLNDLGNVTLLQIYGSTSAETLETLTFDNRGVLYTNAPEGLIIASDTSGVTQQPIIFATRETAGTNTMNTMYFVGDNPRATLNAAYENDSDSFGLYFNWTGYRGGVTRYRDTYICDGKQGTIAFFDGSAGTTDLYGKLTVDHIGEHTASHGSVFDDEVGIGVDPFISAFLLETSSGSASKGVGFGGTVRSAVYILENRINSGYNDSTDMYILGLNYSGYSGSAAYFRDTVIYDGKNTPVVLVDGSAATLRMNSASNRRYYHLPAQKANPGAAGATWVPASANNLAGFRLTNASHILDYNADVHADWDGTSNITVEIQWCLGAAGSDTDVVDLKLVCYYNTTGDTSTKTQTLEVSTPTTGEIYKVYTTTFTIDVDAVGNVVEVGDHFSMVLNLETDTSEIDNVIIHDGAFFYPTNHVSIESGDA